ncbi:MAG: hypothetical protein C5B44_03530 [Acidobacteria bacterium]|nr:MAG: hypothetical protein C5B44_03530 [Acidobacteriota bacterium]
MPPATKRFLSSLLLINAFVLLCLLCCTADAQQPFYTDDADVTEKGHFHLEFSNEYDLLQRSLFPNLRQNTADLELDYGLAKNLEVGVESPLITIFNAPEILPRATGIGDTNFSAKYNFIKEREHSRLPAMTVQFNVEFPTGSVISQLGSGLTDYYINGIMQKSLSTKTKLRLNGGILLAGNETTGVIGIKTRGTVLTSGGSLVKQFKPKLQLGVELVGALDRTLELGRGQLQAMVGGNYQFKPKMSFDFGVLGGKYTASPRVGVQVGISVDF